MKILGIRSLLLAGMLLQPSWPSFPWQPASSESLEQRISPPAGFQRLSCGERSFGAWLRALPIKPGRPPVRLYNGQLKANQNAHYAVLDVDTGSRNLQQCADAVMRLRAEYLRSVGCDDAIRFRFTSGDLAAWSKWRNGERPIINGRQVAWRPGAEADGSYQSFRRYLDRVFIYAGTASLERELARVAEVSLPLPGDVYIHGGSPGHAVLVADVCVSQAGERMFLLVQSYMPAQEIHVLMNPAAPGSPWYQARSSGILQTPEWTFDYRDLRRFPAAGCGVEQAR